MRIGALARAADCPVETIRYYEKEGLLAEPVRSEANYRQYREKHLEQLLFIRNCRALDMNLGEIRQLLALRDQPRENCTEVDAVVEAHIVHVNRRIAALQALEAQLMALRGRCPDERDVADCGILEQLTRPRSESRRRRSGRGDSHVPASHGR